MTMNIKTPPPLRFFAVITVLMIILAAGRPLAAGAENGETMTNTYSYPDGISYVKVHDARDDHHFLLGASIIKHGNLWICAYGQSRLKENDCESRFACRYSFDGCLSWSEETVIAGPEGDRSHSHGVLFDDNGTVWAFYPGARYAGGSTYPELKMEASVLRDHGLVWEKKGVVLDTDFWPLCEPMRLDDGSLLIAGLYTANSGSAPAVAVNRGDLMKWELSLIPDPSGIKPWGETSVVGYSDRLVAFVRTAKGKAAFSESFDSGRTWSALALSDHGIADSKMYGGTLGTGSRYLIYNSGSRKTLSVAVGKTDGSEGFSASYLIRNGWKKDPVYLNNRQWSYPYAVEDDGKLYVVYSENKENCELAIIPISSLSPDVAENETFPKYEQAFLSRDAEIPAHRVLLELKGEERSWWTGDGGDGTLHLRYDSIEGLPAVVRTQASDTYSKGSQTLRRHFSLDMSEVDLSRTGFLITFYSMRDASPSPDAKSRLFFGRSESKTGRSLQNPSDYTITSRIDYKDTGGNLWREIRRGWNTWFVSFASIGDVGELDGLNSFFIIFADDRSIGEGEDVFAIESVKIIELDRSSASDTKTTAAETLTETSVDPENGTSDSDTAAADPDPGSALTDASDPSGGCRSAADCCPVLFLSAALAALAVRRGAWKRRY